MARTYGFLSTYPPTNCGLATFCSSLAAHLMPDHPGCGIVQVITGPPPVRSEPGVVHTWSTRTVAGWQAAASTLNAFDVAIVQHEYGIYPGADGRDIVPLLHRLVVPSIVVLHTVLAHPTPGQRAVLERVVRAASAVVTMTDTAENRLLTGYAVDPAKVTVIPHGTADYRGSARPDPVTRPGRRLLTWGLLGPGKGIEWALRALGQLRDLTPDYVVAGRTHPKVLAYHGDAYRAGLYRLGAELGIADLVTYQATYLDPPALGELIRSADVVVLPYDSHEQVTSGVLVEAVSAGVPVVATRFPHAVELLTDGPGLLVPHADPTALADAVRRVLTEPGLSGRLVGGGRPSVRTPRWPVVAVRYDELAARLHGAVAPAGAPA